MEIFFSAPPGFMPGALGLLLTVGVSLVGLCLAVPTFARLPRVAALVAIGLGLNLLVAGVLVLGGELTSWMPAVVLGIWRLLWILVQLLALAAVVTAATIDRSPQEER